MELLATSLIAICIFRLGSVSITLDFHFNNQIMDGVWSSS
jgi:hypothetical protein